MGTYQLKFANASFTEQSPTMHYNKHVEKSESKRVKLKWQVIEILEKLKRWELVNTECLIIKMYFKFFLKLVVSVIICV